MPDPFTRALLEALNNATEPPDDGVEVSEGNRKPASQDMEQPSSSTVPEVEIMRPENRFAATVRTFMTKARSSQ
jgi:hypothetical protein